MNAVGKRPLTVAWRGVVALVAVAGGVTRAQTIENLALARTYGAGVHAYFSGDFDRCYDELTAAIEAGSEDPRALYFRGLAALRLGRLDEAEADFSSGAMLESRVIGGWPVSRSLERVQGHDRIQLERHRTRARVAAVQRDRAAERERFIDAEAAGPDVLRRRRPATLPTPATDAANPFADRPGNDAEPVEQQNAPAPEPAMELPGSSPADDPAEVPAETVLPAAEAESSAEPAVPFESVEPAAEPAPEAEAAGGQ